MVIMSANISRHCEPCLSGLNVTFNARQYCTDCEESYCENCSPVHKSQKATRNHNLKDIEELLDNNVSLSKYCEPCLENGVSFPAVARCEECIESYCENCGRIHKSQKATRSHEIKTLQVEQSTEEKRQEIELYKWLDKMEEYRSEIAMTEKFKKEMTDNKDFTYKRRKMIQDLILLRKGLYTMNCLHCNVTCHDNCECNNDENKAKCDVMNSDGYCTVCEDHCYWDKHKSTPYRIEFKQVEEDCTYTEMKRNYEMAEAEVKFHEAIVIKLKKELDEIENDIIKWLALGANAKNIDFIIEKEKWGRKPGFQDRINNLKSLKKKIAFVDDEVKHLQKNKKATLCE